jgi:hypothetical protein
LLSDFKGGNFNVAPIALSYLQNADIEGKKITASYLPAKDFDPEKINAGVTTPEKPVDLIRFDFNTTKSIIDPDTQQRIYEDVNYNVVVPVKTFSEETIKKFNLEDMPKGDINEHYNIRGETKLTDKIVEQLKKEYKEEHDADIDSVTLDKLTRNVLEEKYRTAISETFDNPLAQDDFMVEAIKLLNPKVLQYSKDIILNGTTTTKDEFGAKMSDKVYEAFEAQQAKNTIVKFSRDFNGGKVAQETTKALGA